MYRKYITAGSVLAALIAAASPGYSQAAPSTDTKSTTADTADEVITLNPFTVSAGDEGSGYQVKDTLAGTRVRTELKDVASAISVVSSQFLQDTGSRKAEDLLVYTTNTEIGGIRGNFSGAAGGSTYNEANNLLRPNNNTRVRGLDAADNTRDYFLTEIPWDGFNVDRVDLQRGPNSILFGVGSPAGIINTSVNGASFNNAVKIENRLSNHGSYRTSFDINRSLLNQQLGVRIAAVDDKTIYRQKPSFNHDRRIYGALRWDPKLLGENGHTTVRINFEKGKIEANRPRILPPIDAITPWFLTGTSNGYANMNKMTLNPITTWDAWGGNTIYPNQTYPWFREAFMGRTMSSNIANYYDATIAAPLITQMPNIGTSLGRDANGAVDGTINGIEFARPWGISTFNAYARGVIAGGKYYSDVSLSDPTIFDFYNNLMDGDNKREKQGWTASNMAVSQTFFGDRVGVEAVYDYQRYNEYQSMGLNGGQYQISIDINTHLMDGTPNPNVGRPYVGNSGQYGNNENYSDRDSYRLTAFGDLRGEDLFGKGRLAQIVGHHIFTGLFSQDLRRVDQRGFSRWAADPAWTDVTGGSASIMDGARQMDWIAYIGPSLANRSSASGANLTRLRTSIAPSEFAQVRYFDSQWNAPGVSFNAPYTYNTYDSNMNLVPATDVQAENPANYVGWRTRTFRVLSAERGDIASLYSSGQKSRNKIKSQGITWQGYFFDGNVVPVFGWRKDKVTNASTQAPKGNNGVSMMDYGADISEANTRTAQGESKSYGVVIHTPRRFREKMPLGTHISLFSNKSENFKADAPRGDIFGNMIPNPKGDTKDLGVVISTLNDRLTLRINKYETKMINASLQADNAGFSNSLYYVWALPYWGATHALAALDGIATPQLRQGSWGWPWNGIAVDANGNPDSARIGAIVRDFFTRFPFDQHFSDEYGLSMNIALMHSQNQDDWYRAVPTYGVNGQGASALGLQPLYGGRLRSFGSNPAASVDTTSKGMEYELTAQLMKNWSLTLNASKTEASRTAISPTLDTWITTYTQFLAGDAGLIRIWGGDTARTNWANQVLAPYNVLRAQIGSAAPEIAEWRFNMVTNYSIDRGTFKGVNVGLAYRWEGKRILGYQYNATNDSLDINKPWYGPTDKHIDLWVGYSRKIGNKLNWRVQLNLRNVGESVGLVPVNIQPNGQVALSRIQDGMGWQLSNTFSF